mmetsp:Transcript_40881/g.67085  ORF Transcript_40881/g.67085 Transcript_40881/m.67085 type:complete len:110 (-) Transcript_40881:163-492(-)
MHILLSLTDVGLCLCLLCMERKQAELTSCDCIVVQPGAATGSGIVGDSLYGDSPIAWFGDQPNTNQKQEIKSKSTMGTDISKTLRLHAHRRIFPNPKSGEKVAFGSPKP